MILKKTLHALAGLVLLSSCTQQVAVPVACGHILNMKNTLNSIEEIDSFFDDPSMKYVDVEWRDRVQDNIKKYFKSKEVKCYVFSNMDEYYAYKSSPGNNLKDNDFILINEKFSFADGIQVFSINRNKEEIFCSIDNVISTKKFSLNRYIHWDMAQRNQASNQTYYRNFEEFCKKFYKQEESTNQYTIDLQAGGEELCITELTNILKYIQQKHSGARVSIKWNSYVHCDSVYESLENWRNKAEIKSLCANLNVNLLNPKLNPSTQKIEYEILALANIINLVDYNSRYKNIIPQFNESVSSNDMKNLQNILKMLNSYDKR